MALYQIDTPASVNNRLERLPTNDDGRQVLLVVVRARKRPRFESRRTSSYELLLGLFLSRGARCFACEVHDERCDGECITLACGEL